MSRRSKVGKLYFRTRRGRAVLGDSRAWLAACDPASIDLIVTSPPFGLVRKKEYGNEDADRYVDWFRPFAEQFRRTLKPNGSLVIDIGGAWKKGLPTRSLYHFKLLISLCEEFGFHLAQEFYWWNPAKLPTPAEWVNIRRIRVKDAVNSVYWLSQSPYPKASNRRVLTPYSDSMNALLESGYRAKKRPSGHDISTKFIVNNGAAIPPNLIALAHTESNSQYLRYCKERNIAPHPARFPAELPEYFVRMVTERGDSVVDPFGGSCVTGEVCERLDRRWTCIELVEDYLEGARGRFSPRGTTSSSRESRSDDKYYRIARPDALWNGIPEDTLRDDGGAQRPTTVSADPKKPKKIRLQTDLLE